MAMIATTFFFLFMGFSSPAAAGKISPQKRQAVAPSKTAGNSGEMVSQQNLPVVTLPEVVCTEKKTPPLLKVLFDKTMKIGVTSIEIPKIRMVDFSTIVDEILTRLR